VGVEIEDDDSSIVVQIDVDDSGKGDEVQIGG
jgi:hypothetical protein